MFEDEQLMMTVSGTIKEKFFEEESQYRRMLKIALEEDIIEVNMIVPIGYFESLNNGDTIKVYLILGEYGIDGYNSKENRSFCNDIHGRTSGCGSRAFIQIFDYAEKQNLTLKDICFEISLGNEQFFIDAGFGTKLASRFIEVNKNAVNMSDYDGADSSEENIVITQESDTMTEAKSTLKSLGFSSQAIDSVLSNTDFQSYTDANDIVQKAIPLLQ